MKRPLAIDLFCGLGGWSDGFVAEGYDVVGFDIERHHYGNQKYPGQLVIQDVLTLHGSQFRDAAVIVCSPPCQKYSYLAMPWSRSPDPNNSKAAKALRKEWETNGPDNRLFDACFRIQREAIKATGKDCPACFGLGPRHSTSACARCGGSGWITRYIPLIVENVRGAQPWVGRSAWNYGSFHLWGDVPALMPINLKRPAKNSGGSWFNVAHNTGSGVGQNPVHELTGAKTQGGSWFRERNGEPQPGIRHEDRGDGLKIGGDWFSDPKSTCRKHGSRSQARKAASAQIAKIPLPLSQYLAQVFKPRESMPSPFSPPPAALFLPQNHDVR